MIILGNGRFWFWIGVVCVKEMGNLLTTSLSIALLLLIYGLWCLHCLAFIGLCRKQWWSCWLVGKESLEGIRILLFGWLCPCVWCGAFGGRGITSIFEDLERSVSDLKLFFLKNLLDWVTVLGFRSFSSIHGFMDFCTLCTWFDFVLDVYFLYTQVTLLFFLIYLYYL